MSLIGPLINNLSITLFCKYRISMLTVTPPWQLRLYAVCVMFAVKQLGRRWHGEHRHRGQSGSSTTAGRTR